MARTCHQLLIIFLPIIGLAAFIFQFSTGYAGRDSKVGVARWLSAVATAITLMGIIISNLFATCACFSEFKKNSKGCDPKQCAIISLIFIWVTFIAGFILDIVLWLLSISWNTQCDNPKANPKGQPAPVPINCKGRYTIYGIGMATIAGACYFIACLLAAGYVWIFSTKSHDMQPTSTTMEYFPTANPVTGPPAVPVHTTATAPHTITIPPAVPVATVAASSPNAAPPITKPAPVAPVRVVGV